MFNPIQIVQDVLMKEISVDEGAKVINEWYNMQTNQVLRSKTSCLLRLFRCLISIVEQGEKGNWHDFAGHLRQTILMHNHRFQLHEEFVQPLSTIKDLFNFSIASNNEINVLDTYPSWFHHADKLKAVFQLEQRRNSKTQLGDGILYHMTRFTHYISREQKVLVQACLSMNAGETLLACLPTGGGKSLIGQLPAYMETRGGTIHGGVAGAGTTIVVVPTVALALDQFHAAKKFFKNALSEGHQPQAYVSGISEEKKKIIYEGLRNGTLPLLYTSPEAILNGRLHKIILESAKQGKINRLVIDEAHIVVDWGSAFRTEFQLLSVFRKKLIEASSGAIKTVLLSATLTESSSSTLKQLFSEKGHFIEIRSDALRYEPIYFLDQPSDAISRQERILEILPLLPRPIILYVTKREDAQKWEFLIRNLGFTSVEQFTGDTSSNDRDRILKLWNSNQLDLIVATSAFGMGVDKPDIRTVIHCCLPESVNRFYQEVGRGGRDGFSSISLLSTIQDDLDEASSLTKSNVLTEKRMAERWGKLRTQPTDRVSGDEFWINTDVRPHDLKDNEPNQSNANWNETAILFLYRWGLIDILDFRKEENDTRRSLLIKMLEINYLENQEKLIERLEPDRKTERERLNYDFQQIKDLVWSANKNCYSNAFQETYPFANEACGGCPVCHASNTIPYCFEAVTEIKSKTLNSISLPTGKLIDQHLGHYQELFIYLQQQQDVLDVNKLANLLRGLISSGVNTIVIPSLNSDEVTYLLSKLPNETHSNYTLFAAEEFLENVNQYITLNTTAIIYPLDVELINQLYEWTKRYVFLDKNNKVIHISHRDLYLPNERKHLIELIDGITLSSEQLIKEDELEEEYI